MPDPTPTYAPCPDCGGSGSENGMTGKGRCFKCKGTGKLDVPRQCVRTTAGGPCLQVVVDGRCPTHGEHTSDQFDTWEADRG